MTDTIDSSGIPTAGVFEFPAFSTGRLSMMVPTMGFRWRVAPDTSTVHPVLQQQWVDAGLFGHTGEWRDVPVVAVP